MEAAGDGNGDIVSGRGSTHGTKPLHHRHVIDLVTQDTGQDDQPGHVTCTARHAKWPAATRRRVVWMALFHLMAVLSLSVTQFRILHILKGMTVFHEVANGILLYQCTLIQFFV